MQENPESNEKKVTKDSYYEVPGVVKAEIREEAGGIPEGKAEERNTNESTGAPRKEPAKREFEPQGELEPGYTRESWAKPEGSMEDKETIKGTAEERKILEKSEFKAPGEIETGYTEKSWEKPEPGMEEKKTSEETRYTEAGAGEQTGEDTGEERRTVYTAKKRLTKSKKDRMLFGVCGGLGEYFGIDPTFIRLAFAALALQGIGIVLYIILAIIMPSGKSVEMVPSTRSERK